MAYEIRYNSATRRWEAVEPDDRVARLDARAANATVEIQGFDPATGQNYIGTGVAFQEEGRRYIVASSHTFVHNGALGTFLHPNNGERYAPIFDGDRVHMVRLAAINPLEAGCEQPFQLNEPFRDVAVFEILDDPTSNRILADILASTESAGGKPYSQIMHTMVEYNRAMANNPFQQAGLPAGFTNEQLIALPDAISITPINLDQLGNLPAPRGSVRMVTGQTNLTAPTRRGMDHDPNAIEVGTANANRTVTQPNGVNYIELNRLGASVRAGHSGALVYPENADDIDEDAIGIFTGIQQQIPLVGERIGAVTPISVVRDGINAAQGQIDAARIRGFGQIREFCRDNAQASNLWAVSPGNPSLLANVR